MSAKFLMTQMTYLLLSGLVLSCSTAAPRQVADLAAAPAVSPLSASVPVAIKIAAQQPKDMRQIVPKSNQIEIAMAYAGKANFTGQPVVGYQANLCYLQQDSAQALYQVAEQAERLGYRLLLLDCYRPHSASTHFMRWVENGEDTATKSHYYPRLDKAQLKNGYIAAQSGHSRGSTLDLTLQRKNAQGQWQQLDMGGHYDLFDTRSHLDSPDISAQQKANRLLLKDLMQQQGFKPYALEWWHFTFANEKYPNTYFDFYIR